MSIVFDKIKVVLWHQKSQPIACNELVAAVMTIELAKQAIICWNCLIVNIFGLIQVIFAMEKIDELCLDRFISTGIKKFFCILM